MAFSAQLLRSGFQRVAFALELVQSNLRLRTSCRATPLLAVHRLSDSSSHRQTDAHGRSRSKDTASSLDVHTHTNSGLSSRQRIRGLVRDYGATAVVLYMTMSTTSLTTCYLLVSYGVDIQAVITYLGISQTSRFASGASTFVIAYACHKLLLPIRLAVTATATPLIVHYLRQIGWIKKPNVNHQQPK